jgi:hypothetical protein
MLSYIALLIAISDHKPVAADRVIGRKLSCTESIDVRFTGSGHRQVIMAVSRTPSWPVR